MSMFGMVLVFLFFFSCASCFNIGFGCGSRTFHGPELMPHAFYDGLLIISFVMFLTRFGCQRRLT